MEKFILSSLTVQMFALGLNSSFITNLTKYPVLMILLGAS